jgi:hypothetical protein
MLDYHAWVDIVSGLLIGTALVLLMYSRTQITGQQRKFTLPASIIGGLGLCFLSASIALPPLLSPRLTLEGTVIGFRRISGYRGGSHFEFRLNANRHVSNVLRAHYFDKGFYFSDPSVSDGDVIRVLYVGWTNDILEISESPAVTRDGYIERAKPVWGRGCLAPPDRSCSSAAS